MSIVRSRGAPRLDLHVRVGGHERLLAVRQARDEQPCVVRLSRELVRDGHPLARPVEFAEVARYVLPGHGRVTLVAPCRIELAEARVAVGFLVVARGEHRVLLPQQRQRHRSVAPHLAPDPLEVDLGEALRLVPRPAPDQLVCRPLGKAGDVFPGDALLLGLLQDVLHGRPRATARVRDLRLRHAVGVVPQDVSVTHVLSHVVTPFLSVMRSSLPHRADCRARKSPAGMMRRRGVWGADGVERVPLRLGEGAADYRNE